MIFVFYLFAAVLVFTSWKSLRGGINYLNFFKKEIARPESDFTPFASIIAPCRGLDEDLEANLSALFRQDFPEYEILFVVDDENDEAVKIIEKVSREGAKAQREENKQKRANANRINKTLRLGAFAGTFPFRQSSSLRAKRPTARRRFIICAKPFWKRRTKARFLFLSIRTRGLRKIG